MGQEAKPINHLEDASHFLFSKNACKPLFHRAGRKRLVLLDRFGFPAYFLFTAESVGSIFQSSRCATRDEYTSPSLRILGFGARFFVA